MNIKRRLTPLLAVVAVMCLAGSVAVAEKPQREERAQRVSGAVAPGGVHVDLREGDKAEEVSTQGAYLPFSYTFTVAKTLSSRLFWPSYNGRACVNLRGTGSADPAWWGKEVRVEMWNSYGTDVKVGATVRYVVNGSMYGYCWTGLYPYHEHYFKIVKDWSTTSNLWGDGQVVP